MTADFWISLPTVAPMWSWPSRRNFASFISNNVALTLSPVPVAESTRSVSRPVVRSFWN